MDTFNQVEPTISQSTVDAYKQRYLELERRFARDAGVDSMSPDEVVAALLQVKSSLSMSTFRQYKASILYVLERDHAGSDFAIELLRSESSAGLKKASSLTSGAKQKFVPDPVWKVFQDALLARAKMGYKRSRGLLQVLTATLCAGLRPNEWATAEITTHATEQRAVLRIQNSKHSNGRANGEQRELFIDALNADELTAIQEAIEFCGAGDDAAAMERMLKNELADTKRWIFLHERGNTKVRPRHINPVTLYSFRHQFIADAKSTWDDPVLVSAAAGHSSTRTAFKHYGKRKNGQRAVRVLPTPESIAAVHNVKMELYKSFLSDKLSSHPMGPS
jgi:integrase